MTGPAASPVPSPSAKDPPRWLRPADPNSERAFDLLESLQQSHARAGRNDFEFAIDTRGFFRRDEAKIRAWLENDVKPVVAQGPHTVAADERAPAPAAFHVIVAPLTQRNVAFVALVNEVVFGGSAHVVAVDTEAEFKDSFVARYADLAQLQSDAASAGVELVFHYVDDAVVRGANMTRLLALLAALLSTPPDGAPPASSTPATPGFETVILLVNRWSMNTWRGFMHESEPRIYRFVDLYVPHLAAHTGPCPLCEENDALHHAEDTCSCARMAGAIRDLRLSEFEPVEFDKLPNLVRCSNGQPLPSAVARRQTKRQLLGRRRFWWRHRLTEGLHRVEDQNSPVQVLALLVNLLSEVAARWKTKRPGNPPGGRAVDHFCSVIWAATTGLPAARKAVQEASLALVNALLEALTAEAGPPPAPPPAPPQLSGEAMPQITQKLWEGLMQNVAWLSTEKATAVPFDESMDDRTAAESLARCLMRAVSRLGGTALIRRDTIVRVFKWAHSVMEPGERLDGFAAYYAYCLKLLFSRGPDRAKPAFLEHLLLRGLEPADGEIPTVLADPQGGTVGTRFAASLDQALPAALREPVATFADLAYLENTKCLDAIIRDMTGEHASELPGAYLPEYAVEYLESREITGVTAEGLAEQLIQTQGEIKMWAQVDRPGDPKPNPDDDPKPNIYDSAAGCLNRLWQAFLGLADNQRCRTHLVLEVRESTLGLEPLAGVVDLLGVGVPAPGGAPGNPTRVDSYVVTRRKRQTGYLAVGGTDPNLAPSAEAYCEAAAAAESARRLGRPSEPLLLRFSPQLRGYSESGQQAGADIALLPSSNPGETAERVCLVRIGLDGDPASPLRDAYVVLTAPAETDIAELQQAARAVAFFRGALANLFKSEQRRGVLRPVAQAKQVQRELSKTGALNHQDGSSSKNHSLHRYVLGHRPYRDEAGKDGEASCQAFGAHVDWVLANLNRALFLSRVEASGDGRLEPVLRRLALTADPAPSTGVAKVACRSLWYLPGLHGDNPPKLELRCGTAEPTVATGYKHLGTWAGDNLPDLQLFTWKEDGRSSQLSPQAAVVILASLVNGAIDHSSGSEIIIRVEVDDDGYVYVENPVDGDSSVERVKRGLARREGLSLAAVAELFASLDSGAGGRPVRVRLTTPAAGGAGTERCWLSIGVPLFEPSHPVPEASGGRDAK
ncbi:MAG: hypothetical protein LBD97_01075, partial [Bifidobacteriaceae bacterium]|nr:hypothetical protein [Bifidobacteriaceae bacterium]